MSKPMQTDLLKCSLNKEQKRLMLESKLFDHTSIKAGFALKGRSGDATLTLSDTPWEINEDPDPGIFDLPFEIQGALLISLPTSIPGVKARAHVVLLADRPLLLIQIEVLNETENPLRLERLSLLQVDAGDLSISGVHLSQPAFYSNGWQSWSATGTYQVGDRQHQSKLGRFQNPMVRNPGTPKTKGRNHFSGDMFGVLGDLEARIGFLAGFLSQKNHFGSLESHFEPAPSLELWANGDGASLTAGEWVYTDWAALGFVNVDAPEPLEHYLSSVAEIHANVGEPSVPVGWCSWYHFYTDITEEVIESNLEAVLDLHSEIPLSLFQIDDGFETYPGDWFDFTPAFPGGLEPLARKAHEAGLTPGVWLAPFIVHPKAKLVEEHPEWLLRDTHGKPVTAGFAWNRFTHALDLTHPDALAYSKKVIRTAVEKWGFEYLKLDFLFAAALDGDYQDKTKTRAQVLRMGLEALREAAGPEITLLGCGCPLGSGLGIFEAMRISADVSGYWEPHFPPISPVLRNEPHMPSVRNALQNILSRSFLHQNWWINDPDCLLVRPETKLTLAEVQTLTSAIGLTGGSLLLSDDLPALSDTRLRLAKVLLPVIDQRARIIDWLDRYTPSMLRLDLEGATGNWHLLAYFNWDNKNTDLDFTPQDYHLPEDHIWWVREFWTGEIGQMSADAPFTAYDVPPNGVRVLAVQPYDPEHPAYLGSNLHLSQGMEVGDWTVHKNEIQFSLDLGHAMDGKIYIYLPKPPAGARIGDQTLMLEDRGRRIYSLYLAQADGKEILIKY